MHYVIRYFISLTIITTTLSSGHLKASSKSDFIDFEGGSPASQHQSSASLDTEATGKERVSDNDHTTVQSKITLSVDDNIDIEEESQTVLVIEDIKLVHLLFSMHFTKNRQGDPHGYNLVFASTGERGVELHDMLGPFLTFIDYDLGYGMNGAHVANQIRANSDNPGLLVAFSANPK